MSSQEEPPFYLVWNPYGRAPTFQHPTFTAAEREAGRLAEACPGQEFFVLCPRLSIVKAGLTRRSFAIDEIPF